MNKAKTPRSLRSSMTRIAARDAFDSNAIQLHSGHKVTVACLVAVGSIGAADAQPAPLPPVTVDAPVTRSRPAATRPSAEQLRARAAVRRAARRQKSPVRAAPQPAVNLDATQAADRNPYS